MTTKDQNRIAAIESRVEAVTPGRWIARESLDKRIQYVQSAEQQDFKRILEYSTHSWNLISDPAEQKANVDFIAAAKGDIEWLLLVIQKLTAKLSETKAIVQVEVIKAHKENFALVREIKELRAVLKGKV